MLHFLPTPYPPSPRGPRVAVIYAQLFVGRFNVFGLTSLAPPLAPSLSSTVGLELKVVWVSSTSLFCRKPYSYPLLMYLKPRRLTLFTLVFDVFSAD